MHPVGWVRDYDITDLGDDKEQYRWTTLINNNHVHDVRYGLHYMYSNFNVFNDNVFVDNVAGAALMYSHNIGFYRNVFARCRGFRAYGILYQSMDDTRAEHNLVMDNSRGIFLNNSSGNVLLYNDVVDNDVAVQLNGGGDDNVVARNNFIEPTEDQPDGIAGQLQSQSRLMGAGWSLETGSFSR